MITCQVGKKKIDTFSYEPKQLREWSNKGLLRCPVCGSKMIYNHGEFKIPHFKHEKNCDCPDMYSEGVTEEHIKGIELLHNWLQKQEGITNIELEKWIPETKQRPDIYFEYENKPYVIEFQCSPIATKFLERRELYRLNEINDIWILGCDKYEMKNYIIRAKDEGDVKIERLKLKTIEKELYENEEEILYINYKTDKLFKVNKYDLSLIYSDYSYEPLKTNFGTILSFKSINKIKLSEMLSKTMYLDNAENKKYRKLINNVDRYIEKLNNLEYRKYYRKQYNNYRNLEGVTIGQENGNGLIIHDIEEMKMFYQMTIAKRDIEIIENSDIYKWFKQEIKYINWWANILTPDINDYNIWLRVRGNCNHSILNDNIDYILDINSYEEQIKNIYIELTKPLKNIPFIIKETNQITEYFKKHICDKKYYWFYMNYKFNLEELSVNINFGFGNKLRSDIKILNDKIICKYYSSDVEQKITYNKFNFNNKIKKIISDEIRRLRYENI